MNVGVIGIQNLKHKYNAVLRICVGDDSESTNQVICGVHPESGWLLNNL